MQLNYILSRLIAFSLAFLLGICIYVFGVDFLRNCLGIDISRPEKHLHTEFQPGEFKRSLNDFQPLLSKLGQPTDKFRNVKDAVQWLNTSIKPYQIYAVHMKKNETDQYIKYLLPPDFKTMSEDQLRKFALTVQGQELKRQILIRLYGHDMPYIGIPPLKKHLPTEFQTGELKQSLNDFQPLLSKLGQPTDKFRNVKDAVQWLNTSIKPYQIYAVHMRKNETDQYIKYLLPPDFKTMSEDQLRKFALTVQGQELKRQILIRLYKNDLPWRPNNAIPYASVVSHMPCGDGIITIHKECDAGKDNGFDTSSSLQTYLLYGKWFCSETCTATNKFAFWEPKT